MPQRIVEIFRPYENPNFMNERTINAHNNDFLRTNRTTTNRNPTNQATRPTTNRIFQNNIGSRNNNQNRNWSNGK